MGSGNRKDKQDFFESEERYRMLFENNIAAIFRSEIDGNIVEYNSALAAIFEYEKTDDLKKVKVLDLYYSFEDRDACIKKLRVSGFLKNYEIRMKTKKGKEIWILENAMLLSDPKTNKEYMEGTLIDITELKRIQHALQEREKSYISLIEHTPNGIVIHDEKGEILYANAAILNMSGISSLEETKNKNIFSFLLPEYHDKIRFRKNALHTDKQSPFIDVKVCRPDGKIIEVKIKTTPFIYLGKEAVEVVIHDSSLQNQLEREHTRFRLEEESNRELKREIASHIRTRQRLNASQKYSRLLLNSSLDMIFAYDRDRNITEFNQSAQTTFGYLPDEIAHKNISILYADKEYAEKIGDIVFEDGNFTGSAIHIRKNGEKFPAYVSASVLKNEKGEVLGAMSISRDVTGIKETEDELKKSIHEKEILIKEIHHRVKNNLQVISSILKLQSGYVKDEKTIELFNDCRNRIASMAFIHAALYMAKDFANVNFGEYAGNIARNLQQSYSIKDKKVLLKLDIPPIHLHIDDAIPCGLIINELLSNSFKYAFVKKKTGTIGISVKVKKESIILATWDNGTGFPKNVDYKNTESLGLQLVISLVEQIGGRIKMKSRNNEGTEFIIVFRKKK